MQPLVPAQRGGDAGPREGKGRRAQSSGGSECMWREERGEVSSKPGFGPEC